MLSFGEGTVVLNSLGLPWFVRFLGADGEVSYQELFWDSAKPLNK